MEKWYNITILKRFKDEVLVQLKKDNIKIEVSEVGECELLIAMYGVYEDIRRSLTKCEGLIVEG